MKTHEPHFLKKHDAFLVEPITAIKFKECRQSLERVDSMHRLSSFFHLADKVPTFIDESLGICGRRNIEWVNIGS